MTALSALTETTSIADLDQIYVLDGANSRRVSWSNLKAQLKADTPLKNLFEDAVDVLSQRNGASDQAYHLYNTYTNASNYERLEFRWSAGNILEIATARAGTGSNRSIRVIAGGQTWEFSTAGTLGGPGPISLTGANGYAMFKEITILPSGVAGRGQVYTKDNGAGKTQLMVQFGSGAAQQIAIEP